jgi:hypothetical protein
VKLKMYIVYRQTISHSVSYRAFIFLSTPRPYHRRHLQYPRPHRVRAWNLIRFNQTTCDDDALGYVRDNLGKVRMKQSSDQYEYLRRMLNRLQICIQRPSSRERMSIMYQNGSLKTFNTCTPSYAGCVGKGGYDTRCACSNVYIIRVEDI